MKIGAENKNKVLIAAALMLCAVGYLVYTLFLSGPSTPPPAPAPVITTTKPVVLPAASTQGKKAKVLSSAQLDPTLRIDAMLYTESLTYSGNGRNIFSATSAPAPLPVKPIAPARPIVTLPVAPPPPSGPPPPPPINLKYFGTATSKGGRMQAFLLHGEDVYLASDGDIVSRRYKIVKITSSGVQVTDLTNNNTQTVPLSMN